jgi:inner membrane protein
MPTIFSHALVAVVAGRAVERPSAPPRLWVLAACCAMLPDADVVGLYVGVPYGHMLGHRGLSHSLFFALALGMLLGLIAFRHSRWDGVRTRYLVYLSIATASHGILDAFTDGGGGVAFLAPFTDERYASPWQPIAVSPIGAARFFTQRGLAVMRSELIWIWAPSLAVMLVAALRPRRVE